MAGRAVIITSGREGLGAREAVAEGGRHRLRPILMTAIATIFALLPIALGLTGEGGFISQPLAIVVIGGLVSSTLLTLGLVPTLYTMWRPQGAVPRQAAVAPGPEVRRRTAARRGPARRRRAGGRCTGAGLQRRRARGAPAREGRAAERGIARVHGPVRGASHAATSVHATGVRFR